MTHESESAWSIEDTHVSSEGEFQREETRFRETVTADSSGRFPVAEGRYHLYVSYACPWAHRTLIARALTGLDEAISVSVVDPYRDEAGWRFSPERAGCTDDPIFKATHLSEIYRQADPAYSDRVTVPVLFDREEETIVNNESREILRMFTTAFSGFHTESIDLTPPEQRESIDHIIDTIYDPINNGVYRAGFAASQEAYDRAIDDLFGALEDWNDLLGTQRYLAGDRLTEADICLFTTLVRFDAVYHTHFKCNVKQIQEYEHLWPYLRDIYQTRGVAQTVRMDHIKEHYYTTHPSINPKRLIARGPDLDFDAPHDRDRLEIDRV